jgi:predicted PurR-regulated permease PerM
MAGVEIMTPRPFSPVARWLTLVSVMVGGAIFLWAVHSLLAPFLWAAIIAYAFNPIVTGLAKRTGFHRAWFVVLLYLFLIGLVVGAIVGLLPTIHAEMAQIPDTVADIRDYFGHTNIIRLFGVRIDIHTLSQGAVNSANAFTNSLTQNALVVVTMIFGSIVKLLAFLVATFYFLLDAERIAHWIHSLIPPRWHDEVGALATQVDRVLGAYIRGQLILMGVMTGLAYAAMGPILRLHYALVLALVAGVLELFPVVGPLIAWLLALLTGLLTPHIPYGWSPEEYAIAILVAYAVVRQLQDNITIPNVMGRTLRLHPALVLFVVLCGGYLWGLTGVFLAVPATAVLRIVFRYLYTKIFLQEDRAVIISDAGAEQLLPDCIPSPWTTEPHLPPD